MELNADLIQKYMWEAEQATGWDLIIYDDYRILSDDPEWEGVSQIKRWHLNDFCLKIKENLQLQKRCVALKKQYNNKVFLSTGVCKSTCYCGVKEYAVPIIVHNCMICVVAATGFLGKLSARMTDILAKRTGLSLAEFTELRCKTLTQCSAEKEEQITAYLQVLAVLLREYILQKTNVMSLFKDSQRDGQNQHIFHALSYIQQNFMKPISIDQIAKECNISASYLQHLFLEKKGYGISQEIRSCRLQYASELLCTTGYSVKYIALTCGYQNVDYFSTVFHKHYGLAPLQYRNKYTKKIQS